MEIVFGVTDSSILRPLLFFLGDLFFMISNIDIASYADDNTPYIAPNNTDDNTPYIAGDNIDDIIKSLEEAALLIPMV